MSHPFCPNPTVLQRVYAGPLGAYLDDFVHLLVSQGYASSTAKSMMCLLVALSSWLQRHALTAADLNEQRVDAFLHDRSGRCRPTRSDRSVVRRWLEQRRNQGVIPVPAVEPDARARSSIACDLQHYLLPQRCLAPTTVDEYLDTVQRCLRERFGTQPLRLEVLCPQDIARFMGHQAHRYSPGHTKLLATALRSFFRLLLQRGVIATDLAQAVPTVPNWRVSSLPRLMKGEDVACRVQRGDRSTPQGQRDDAILLLLARLGLRPGEVVAMTIDDLDWAAGDLLVRGTGGRRHQLPLPQDVGEALVTYLCHGRPRCATRRVFVRMKAPPRGFAHSMAIWTIVRRALARAGRNPVCKGGHLLRHSLATQLLQSGASLAEIGELLRHQHIEPTRIDAKVDQGAWRALALPWPGGEV